MTRRAAVHAFRDPIHGFIHADPLEGALINSRPVQRLRSIRQLGFAFLVFPGAEHSRFSHVLGVMCLAGKVYDALAARDQTVLDPDPGSPQRRLIRVTALLHDVGHAPYSHSAEGLFEDGIEHEEMTRRLLGIDEIQRIFDEFGDGLSPVDVSRVLEGPSGDTERVLSQVMSGELDVDKMDYLLRDSLYCGVRYGTFDLDRMLETIRPLQDPKTGDWGLGIEEGGIHAFEALVLARYYMFTQVYFNVTVKAFELHFNEWLQESGTRWPADPEEFLAHDDVSTLTAIRASGGPHARAVAYRAYYPLAFETGEHLTEPDKAAFEALLPAIRERFADDGLMISNSAKDPHRLGEGRVLVRQTSGELVPMEQASQFIRHLGRIERYRLYAPRKSRDAVAAELRELWKPSQG